MNNQHRSVEVKDRELAEHRMASVPNSRLKILYLNAYLNRFDFWTGERGRQFVNALLTAGADVKTLPEVPSAIPQTSGSLGSLFDSLKQIARSKLPARSLILLIEVYLLGRGIGRTLQLAWQTWCKRKELNPDVVLARTFEYEWSPWLVAAILRRPLVLEVHAAFFLEREFRGLPRSRAFKWYECVLWRKAACVWVHTRALQQIIANNGIKSERLHVIPFGLPDDRVDWESQPSDVCHVGEPEPCIQVVFVGSFYSWHGVDLIIEAFSIALKRIANLRLCLIGEGVTRNDSVKRVRQLGIGECVEFPGWLSQQDLSLYLKNSHIGVAPYRRLEPFYFEPVKIMDYMAAGLAIVASDQGQVRELVTDGESGILVPPDDVTALAQALIDLADNEELRQRLGLAARQQTPLLRKTAQHVLATVSEVAALKRETEVRSHN